MASGMMISRRLVHVKTVPKLYASNIDSINFSLSKTSPSASSASSIPAIPTHELLTKLNLISHPHSGLINWLPIGLTIINKIGAIIRSRMNQINFEELQLSLLSHKSLWEQTNRLSNNQEIFELKNQDFLLSPTAEEEITNYVKSNIKSYKNLPILYYQINNKYRNEKRPRSGLLRTKEFLMKDGYSFDVGEKEAMKTYQDVFSAYINIFNDLKLPYVKAEADSGDIGGSMSHEWHYLHQSGEDLLFECDHCHSTSNIEKTLSFPKEGSGDVQDVSVRYFTTIDKSTLVCAYYPTERVLQPNFLKLEIDDIDLNSKLSQSEILAQFENDEEDSLMNKKIIRIMDARLTSRSNFPDFPLSFINRSTITTFTDIPIVEAQQDEICGKCEEGTLSSSKAIEIGHTFYLGDKYSKSLDCSIEIPGSSERQNLIMGCYGIGISRIVASIAEINRDAKGLIWPAIIAPWTVTVISTTTNPEEQYQSLFQSLNDNNVDYKVDNRVKVGLGKKINESNLLGIPLTIILGKHFPIVEIEIRGKRYGDSELNWKQLYDSSKDQYQWKVDYNDENVDVKHYVNKDGIIPVINALLKDM